MGGKEVRRDSQRRRQYIVFYESDMVRQATASQAFRLIVRKAMQKGSIAMRLSTSPCHIAIGQNRI